MILGEPTRAIHAFALILASIAIAACTEQPSPPDVPYVSSDAYFEIAGHPFVLPVVAIPNMSRDSIEGHARNSDKPFRVDRLQLQILRYGTYGEFLASREICPRLTRRWSQDLCRGEQKGTLARLPQNFDLFDRGRLDLLKQTFTVGRESAYDQVRNLQLKLAMPETECDKTTKFCKAAVEALPGVVAVWTVWSDDKQTAQQMAVTQGAAIVEFVTRAIGKTEDETFANF